MLKSYTILYIDDDHDDLMLLAEAFEKHTDHLRVVHAYNGQEGIRVLDNMKRKSSLPCLIILDINMPVMDGKEALKLIRANPAYQNIPVVMFSTSNNPFDKKFAEELGAEFITKPVSYIDMKSLVAEFASKCRFEVEHRA
jgi:CheY-like chemotaxis protein